MKIQAILLNKHVYGLIAALFAVFAVATPASAATQYYYTPVPYQYQYQYQYQPQYQNTAQLIAYLQSLIAQLEALQKQYERLYGHSYRPGYHYNWDDDRDDDYDIDVETLYARDVEDDEATLYGEIDLDDAPYATVWFEYGEGGDLDQESDTERIDRSDDERFSIDVDDVDEDDRYYFRAVAEDPNGDIAYGEIESFDGRSDDDDDDDWNDDNDWEDEPIAETGDTTDIEDDSARIEGIVEMNDFEDGLVFFVYGEDEDMVEDVDSESSYSDIDEEGDDLQKYQVYSNLDGDRSFWLEAFGLDDSTDYYFRICVEYEDEDGDETLECGDVEHFETD